VEGQDVTEKEITDKLTSYLRDARAMEANSFQMLNSMLIHTDDPKMKELIEHHKEETKEHERLVTSRLDELDEREGAGKRVGALLSAGMKGMVDQIRSDKPGKDAPDAYVTEHVEIAAYELLTRLARRAGDNKTTQMAGRILREERAMAERIAGTWDKVIDLTPEEEGVTA
jgi:ferritin-like metal-binding protein YciE